MEGNKTKLPIWLKPMLTTAFYIKCEIHPQLTETKFCKDCITSFCPDCKSIHEHHKTLTVYKASKAVAVRTKDVKESLDSSDICDYSINNRNIYFVHKKAHEGRSSSSKVVVGCSSNYVVECEVCCYRLVKSDRRFCSVECKVAAVEMRARRGGGGGGGGDQIVDQKSVVKVQETKPVFPAMSLRTRRRKQFKPSRAPFF